MRGSGLEGGKSILSTLTKIGFPSKPPFMNSIQQTFIEHLLSVQLCESDKDEYSSKVLTILWDTHI